MNHRGPAGAEPAGTLALFPCDAAWARTSVLDAQAIETADFDLDAFARFRHIRILTYSSSVQMLHTILKRFAEARVECVLGYSRVVSNVASIIALQTAALEEVHGVLRSLPAPSRDDVLERVRDGRLQVRVVEGHVSHAKIFLLSDGPDGERCVLTGSANFSTSALLGDQHEVLIRFRDDRAWEHFERQHRTGASGMAQRCASRPWRCSTGEAPWRKRSRRATGSPRSRTTIPRASRGLEP